MGLLFQQCLTQIKTFAGIALAAARPESLRGCQHSVLPDRGRLMFGLEALDLARIQFAFTISFHILFPAITIGLASYLAVLEGLWLKTHNDTYRDLYHFWSKIFAVNFGMGVVSGLVMAYQFGTNWSRFSDFAGAVTGP
eukprot:gene20902-24841_t